MQNKSNINKLNKSNENNPLSTPLYDVPYDTTGSETAWPSIIAGALIAFTMSFVLLFLGSGLGLSTISPWSNVGITATTFTIATIVWIIIIQSTASSLGGYLTGRLRKRSENSSLDEIYFRDTANGLLSWALATVITAVFFTYTIAPIVSGGTKAATAIAAAGAAGAGYSAQENSDQSGEMNNYFIDNLFRSDSSNTTADDMRAETIRILTLGITEGKLTAEDRTFLSQAITMRTGITQDSANQRINEVVEKINAAKEKATEAADTARKAGMHAALFMFISLLIGAFLSSYFAAFGGRHRDAY